MNPNVRITKEQLPKGGWCDPKTRTRYEFYPGVDGVPNEISELLIWLREVLEQRTDGCEIIVDTHPGFPPHKGKDLPFNIVIKTWDIAA